MFAKQVGEGLAELLGLPPEQISVLAKYSEGVPVVEINVAGTHYVLRSCEVPLATEGLQERLSQRQLEILRLVARGLANKQIARSLSLSQHTVAFHLREVYLKLGIHSRSEALARLGGWHE